MYQARTQASRMGLIVRLYIAVAVYLGLFTDVFDRWIVPFDGRTYGSHRTEFLGDMSEKIGFSVRGAAQAGGDINLKGWVGRH